VRRGRQATLGRMTVVLEVLGWLLVLQGVGGLLNTVFGWWPWTHDLIVINHLPFLEGYAVFLTIVTGVLGFVLLAVAGSAKKSETDR
jgi:hypothetical protein